MKKGRIEFFNISGTGGKFGTKWQCPNILLDKLKLRIFKDYSIMGPNKPVRIWPRYIGGFLNLKMRGKLYWCCNPFHNDLPFIQFTCTLHNGGELRNDGHM